MRLLLLIAISIFNQQVVQTKFQQGDNAAESLANELLQTKNEASLMTYLQNHNIESYAILDENHSVIESYGDITVDFHNKMIRKNADDLEYYYDMSADSNWLLEDDRMKLPFKRLLHNTLKGIDEYSQEWMLQPVHTEIYWIRLPLENGKNSLLVMSKLNLIRKEVIHVFGLFTGIAVLLFIPVIVLLLNVISRIITQHHMYRIFYQDTVTEGKNWTYFLHYTERFLSSFRSAARTYAIIDMQLEKYRSFCACNGVAEGERLLKDINRWVARAVGKRELCVRYAKSNFALLIGCVDEEECKSKLHNLINLLSNNASNTHMIFHVGAYMLYPQKRPTNGRIVRRKNLDVPQYYNYASEARASIEEVEESTVAIFDQKMLDDQMWEHWVEKSMEEALKNEEFLVYLQPKYNPINDVLVGAEALVRWISPEKGFIAPNRFSIMDSLIN